MSQTVSLIRINFLLFVNNKIAPCKTLYKAYICICQNYWIMGKEKKNRAKEALELIMSRYGISGQQEIADMLGFSNTYL